MPSKASGFAGLVLVALCAAGAARGADVAGNIIKASGVKAGLCVHVGCADGKLAAALGRAGNFVVQGLGSDAALVAKARRFIRGQGLYGRVSVRHWASKQLPYADNLVNLLILEDGQSIPRDELMRVLAPNGVIAARRDGRWICEAKPRPKEMDDWTHYRHGPDGNKVSGDLLVGPPARLRWVVGPTWSRRHAMKTLKAMVVSGGRVFYVYDEAPKNVAGPRRLSLIVRDAYNGLLLWKRPIESARHPPESKSRPWRFPTQALVAASDRVYTVLKPSGPLTALDAATGKAVRVFDGADSPTRVICHNNILVLGGTDWVCAVDAATGKPLWKSAGSALNPVIGDGKLFFQSGWNNVACRDLATGREMWKQSITSWADGRRRLCFYHDGRLFLGGGAYAKPHQVHAVSAADGKHLWTRKEVWGGTGIYFARGLVWLKSSKTEEFKHGAALGLDPASGQVKKHVLFPNYYPSGRGHGRCYANTATERFMLLGSRGTDFVELQTGKVHDMRAFCGDCGFGIVPACGLVYMAPNSCTCWRYLGGIRALAAARAGGLGPDNSPRLEKAPAFGAATTRRASPDDWPTLRGNDWRSGVTSAAVPTELGPLWKTELKGRISAPTVAGGSAYVASIDGHQVLALDAATGEHRWSYTAGGRVDSPPTLHEGLCLFGSRDGWVYCLNADDGKLLWRFRAAPAERHIVAFGQLESAWPVHGSVLVKGGLVYFAAGRAPELDGGVTVYALEPRTGKVIWKEPSPVLADVMATGRHRGSAVYVRTWQFEPKTGKNGRPANRPHVRSGSGFLNGSYAVRKRWYNGTASGELLLFKTDKTFPKTWGFSAFARAGINAMTAPGKGEYRLFCREGRGEAGWSVTVPLRVRAVVLAGKTLFVAGPPDVAPPDDPWAAFDGKLGAELWAVSAEDGKKLSELKLSSVPVFDGMAAAGGRLYLTTLDGVLHCFGKK